MAKMVEITYMSEVKELEKLQTRLEKHEAKLVKVQAKAEKLGVTDDSEAHRAWLATVETRDGFIVNKADIQKNGVFFDLIGEQSEIADLKRRIEKAEARLAKKQEALEAYNEEIAKVADLKAKEQMMKESFEQEQKEWAKDGIKLEHRYSGETPNGKRFNIYRNSGATLRSLHCFTLMIDGDTIFTSGEFWRAYAVVKNS